MTFKPLRTSLEVLNDNSLSFRDKLLDAYARYFYQQNKGIENKYSKEFLEILIAKNQDNLLEKISKFHDTAHVNDVNLDLMFDIVHILQQYKNKEISTYSIKNNREFSILKENDFIEFASKSEFGGMQYGIISINKNDGRAYILKDFRAGDVKLQDECFLNKLSKLIYGEKYMPFDSYLTDKGRTAISYVSNSYDVLRNVMKLGGGDIKFKDKEKSIAQAEKGIVLYFDSLKGKKISGLIASIIGMALTENLDGNPGNLMIKEINQNELLFFIVDPMTWSQKNKFNLDVGEFTQKTKEAFKQFSELKYIDENQFKSDLTQLLEYCLENQHDNFIGRIKSGRENNEKQFMEESEAAYNSNIVKENITYGLIDNLKDLISRLSIEEIQEELKPFISVDNEKIDNLYNEFYNENAKIAKLAINPDNETGVQQSMLDNLKENINLLFEQLKNIISPVGKDLYFVSQKSSSAQSIGGLGN